MSVKLVAHLSVDRHDVSCVKSLVLTWECLIILVICLSFANFFAIHQRFHLQI